MGKHAKSRAPKNIPASHFTSNDSSKNIKKEIPNPNRPDRNEFRTGQISGHDGDWVEKPPSSTHQSAYTEAFAARLFNYLCSPDSVPEHIIGIDENKDSENYGKPVFIYSKFIPGFTESKKDLEDLTLGNPTGNTPQHKYLAQMLTMMYLIEDWDPNPGNIDLTTGKRIDLEYAWGDFSRNLRDPEVFSQLLRKNVKRGSQFIIHPIDLNNFPNVILAKPITVLNINQKEKKAELTALGQADTYFSKTVHQYFLKALVFDGSMIQDIISEDIPSDEPAYKALPKYVKNRFDTLKISLVQVAGFRKNVIENFAQYKLDILAEFDAMYNQSADMQSKIGAELDNLHTLIQKCDQVANGNEANLLTEKQAFKARFNIDFDKKDEFHQYAMQMLLVDPDLDEEKLFDLIKNQLEGLKEHLKQSNEQGLVQQINDIKLKIEKASFFEQAKFLFDTDKYVSKILIEQHEKSQATLANKDIISNRYQEIEEKVKNAQLKTNGLIANAIAALPKVNKNEYLIKIFEDLGAIEEADADKFNKLKVLLESCVAYGEDIAKKGDQLTATAFMEKIHTLYMLLSDGLQAKTAPEKIGQMMIAEINKPDSLLQAHKNFFEKMINFIQSLFGLRQIKTLSNTGTAKPLFATKRIELLSNVVQTVRDLTLTTPVLR